MAITIIGQVGTLAPAFNPVYFFLDSTNKALDGFRYLVDIYSGDTAELITSLVIEPRPGDGYGAVNISAILKSYLGEDLEPLTVPRTSWPSHMNYEFALGEEYIVEWEWDDSVTIAAGPFTGGSFTRIFSNLGTNTFNIGDQIFITQNAPNESEVYNNVVTTVVAASQFDVIVPIPFVSTTQVGGIVTFADRRKTQFINLLQVGLLTVFNGAVAHQAFSNWDVFDYSFLENPVAKFLTNVPEDYRVRPENDMRLTFYGIDLAVSAATANLTFNVTTDFGMYTLTGGTSFQSSVGIYGCGPNDITMNENLYSNQVGSFPVFKNLCFDVISIEASGLNTLVTGTGESPWFNNFEDEPVVFYGENGETFTAFIGATPTPNSIVINYPFAQVQSTMGNVIQRTDGYSIVVFSGGSQVSEVKNFKVDWTPAFQFGQNIELVFIDRLGSYIPANFSVQNFRTQSTTRDSYKKVLGDLIPSQEKWGYASIERGRKSINTNITTELTLNSDWLTESEAEFLKELYSSPAVYIKEFEELWPVIVTSDSYQIPTARNKKLIQLTITIVYANPDVINNI